LLRNPKRGGQGPYWTVEPFDDDDWQFGIGECKKISLTKVLEEF
jgi:hypothetical protein